jgi:monofunctional biosynthetic peptidoglycan transglycosylase
MLRRLFLVLPLAVIGAAWCYGLLMPWPALLCCIEPHRTSFMQRRLAEARRSGEPLDLRYEWVPLDRISTRLRRAVVTAEDQRFEEHGGIDWLALREEFRYRGDEDFSWFEADDRRALRRSLAFYWKNRDRIKGRSTITQQLAKNLYFGSDRSVLRKLEEYVVARRLELFLTKDRILELYLNTAEWGPGLFGAEAAARHYFKRSAANLTWDQSAALAATLPHPLTSNPAHRPGRMNWRKTLILRRLGI